MDQRLFAPPHGFSQLITSFIAGKSQGILRTPFFTFFRCWLLFPPFDFFYTNSIYFQLYLICLVFSLLFCLCQYVKDRSELALRLSNRGE